MYEQKREYMGTDEYESPDPGRRNHACVCCGRYFGTGCFISDAAQQCAVDYGSL